MAKGWQNSETTFLIMYQSRKSGGTFSELRKTEYGRDKFLRTLYFFGYEPEDITVIENKKPWKPTRIGNQKKKNKPKRKVNPLNE